MFLIKCLMEFYYKVQIFWLPISSSKIYLNQTTIFLNLMLLDYSFSAVPVLNKDKICHVPVSNRSLLLLVSIQIKYT